MLIANEMIDSLVGCNTFRKHTYILLLLNAEYDVLTLVFNSHVLKNIMHH